MEILKQIPLKNKNWFQTGGPASHYCEPTTNHNFAQALSFAQETSLKPYIIGLGANMLISDDGINGLVIKPQMKKIHIDEEVCVTAEAGVTIEEFVNYCLANNLIGPEEFSGIPGTVGGSVYINIHYFKYALSDFVMGAQLINKQTGKIINVNREWFNFGYDQSALHTKPYLLLNATFKLKKASDIETAYAKGRSTEIIRHRLGRYPYKGTCGCFFRNFLDNEVTLTSNGKKMTYVSYYLDKLGIKGELSAGDACVSYQHANMIVNHGNATSNDIITLARLMQEKVYKAYGILPQPECQLLGFSAYPLLK